MLELNGSNVIDLCCFLLGACKKKKEKQSITKVFVILEDGDIEL